MLHQIDHPRLQLVAFLISIQFSVTYITATSIGFCFVFRQISCRQEDIRLPGLFMMLRISNVILNLLVVSQNPPRQLHRNSIFPFC